MEIRELNIGEISPDPLQPRKTFDESSLHELARSIRLHGLLSPIIVRRQEEKYIIVAGERRFRALQLNRVEKVKVILYEADDYREIALIENLQREDLNPIEEAQAIQALMEEKSYRQEDLAKVLGKSRSYISNSVRLLLLDEDTRKEMLAQRISEAHGRTLLAVEEDERKQLLHRIIEDRLSVRATEELVRSYKKTTKQNNIFLNDALEELEDILGTKVVLQGSAQKGRLIIEYYGQEDLERLIERMKK